MNKIRIVLFTAVAILFFSSCAENSIKEADEKKDKKTGEIALTENFDWLLGNWKRNNEEEGKETFEVWIKNSDSEYSGIGFTIQNNDTLSQERIKLIKSESKWTLKVQALGDVEAVIFNMTSFKDNEFTCENKELDFPKLIKYWKSGEKLNALVAGGEIELSFEFEKTD